jgi:hypothetical protein
MVKKCKLSPLTIGMMCAALVLPLSAFAEADALVKDAFALTEKGQSKEAFDLLLAKEADRAGDPDFDLVLGIAANQTAQFSHAIFALERVLLVQPENARARSELARSLFAVGDTRAARTLLTQAKEQGVPVEVARTIDQFMQAIDKVEEAGRSSVKGYIEFGAGYDDNVNSGPSSNLVAVPSLGGGLFTLTPGSSKTETAYTTVGAGISGRRVIDSRWSLIGSATANLRWNGSNATNNDSAQLDASAGASYRLDKNEYSVALQVGTYDVAGSRARDLVGLVGEWIYRIDGFRQFASYVQLSKLNYPSQGIRDAQRNVLGTSYAQLFRNGMLVFGGAYLGTEDPYSSNVAHLGHQLWGVRAGAQKPFNETLAGFVTLGYEDRQFGGTDPTFLVTRHDQQTNLSVGLSWVPVKAWRVTPLLTYSRTASNISINDFSRSTLGVTGRREF